PRLRVSPQQRLRAAVVQLGQDLDLVRTRGLATRRAARVVFDVANNRYDAYLAAPGVTTFAESSAEQDSLGVLRQRELPEKVVFGRGETPDVPGYAGSGAVTVPDAHAEFNSRGLSEPFGTSGVIYITDLQDPTAVGAVVVT